MANHCIDCDYCGEDMRLTTKPMCKSLEQAKGCYLYQRMCDEAERAALTEDDGNNDEFLTAEDKKWHQEVTETANQLDALRYLRPEVLAFARLMEQQLRANDHKPGWKNDGVSALMDRLREETTELVDALGWGHTNEIAKEAADVANFALMIADVCGCLGEQAVKSCENSALLWEARAKMAEQFMARYSSDEDVPKLLGGYEVQPIVRQLATLLLEAQEAALKGEKA